jgi:hypothetical protein
MLFNYKYVSISSNIFLIKIYKSAVLPMGLEQGTGKYLDKKGSNRKLDKISFLSTLYMYL